MKIFIVKHLFICQLYKSDLTKVNLINSISLTSSVGYINYKQILFINYNKTCNYCQCSSLFTFWNGYLCQKKFYYGEICNSSLQCRQDFNLSCLFGSLCKLNGTSIIFDDIPNKDINQGNIPSIYNRLSWTNGYYLNSTQYSNDGYLTIRDLILF